MSEKRPKEKCGSSGNHVVHRNKPGLVQAHSHVIMHLTRSTDMERLANMAIGEEVDQDDRGNDLAPQNRPDIVNTEQEDEIEDEIGDLEDDHRPDGSAW